MGYNPKCPHCSSNRDTRLQSTSRTKKKRGYCVACSKWFEAGAPKVLLFDIETSRVKVEGNVWQTQFRKPSWMRNDWITEDWYIISWAGKWLFQPDTFGDVVKPKEAKERNDRRVVRSLHDVIKKADFVITHNGNKFDIKNINWRFLIHNQTPQNRYKSIDTLAKCKQVFGVTSLAMDFLCRQLGYDQKHHTDYGLWERCEAGDKQALDSMYSYNLNDIFMLEDLYLRTRPYYKTHPNFSILTQAYRELEQDEFMCHVCMQTVNKSKFSKRWTTPAGYIYKSCECPHCGTMLRQTQADRHYFVKSR